MTAISKEYASALFALALEQQSIDEVYSALSEVAAIFRENPEYLEFLASPGIPKKERVDALMKALEGLPELVCSFSAILTEHGAILEFDRCVREFTLLYQAAKRRSTAYVTSAVPLSEDQKEKLKAKLEAISKNEVELVCTVDKSLLAGVIVNMDETVIDGSVKRRLENLKEIMNG